MAEVVNAKKTGSERMTSKDKTFKRPINKISFNKTVSDMTKICPPRERRSKKRNPRRMMKKTIK